MRLGPTRSSLRSSIAIGVALLGACSGIASDGGLSPSSGADGAWSTKGGAAPSILLSLAQAGSVLSGTGTLGVPALAPVSGPSSPAYTGDDFTITTGSVTSPTVSFTATLGANPDGAGGFYRGALSFSGTQSGSAMTGTLTFTPPRTASQIFAAQTVSGVALTRP